MDSEPVWLAARARRGQRSPESIVDDLLHRASLAMHSVVEQAGNVRVERQGGTHIGIIVPTIVSIKMSSALLMSGSAWQIP
jgi:hypothetical protein